MDYTALITAALKQCAGHDLNNEAHRQTVARAVHIALEPFLIKED
jgi:hypothetical protein